MRRQALHPGDFVFWRVKGELRPVMFLDFDWLPEFGSLPNRHCATRTTTAAIAVLEDDLTWTPAVAHLGALRPGSA